MVQATLTFTGATGAADLTRNVGLDPGRPDCDFGSSFVVDGVPPGEGRRARVEGRDSAGQLVISGSSASFEDPGSGAVTVAVTRSLGDRGTALFQIPDAWRDQYQYLAVGTARTRPLPRIFPDTPEAHAWDAPQGLRRFAVTGLSSRDILYVVWAYRGEAPVIGLDCTLGTIGEGGTYLTAGTVSPSPCTVLAP